MDKIIKTLQLIKHDSSLEDHFFKNLAKASNPLEWLIPLKDAGYFNPNKNPGHLEIVNKKGHFRIPHWNVLDSLENMAVKNEESYDEKVSILILEIVNGIINYKDVNGKRIENERTDWMIFKVISRLPVELISKSHIQFLREALLMRRYGTNLIDADIGKLLLPKLIKVKAKNLILDVLDLILSYRVSEGKYRGEIISIFDPYFLIETLKANKKGISEICAIDAAKVAIVKMQEILDKVNSFFNDMWVPTVEVHEQSRFPDRYQYQLVQFVRDMYESESPIEIKPFVKEMLAQNHFIFKRIAFHLINRNYEILSELFWELKFNPFNGFNTHELFELLDAHCLTFDDSKIEIVLKWVEELDFSHLKDASEINEEKYKAYHKKEWLMAIVKTNNPKVISKLQEYNLINDAVIEHPGFHYWTSGAGWVKEVSPIKNDEEFLSKSNEEIANYICDYKEDNRLPDENFNVISLSSFIKKAVSLNPNKFSENMKPFLSIPRKYQYDLLKGLEDAWRENKEFKWNDLLEFIKEIVLQEEFWEFESNNFDSNFKTWMAGTIADLLQEGTKFDKHTFAQDLLPIAREVILILLDRVKDHELIKADLITSMMNSTKGKVFIALINYSLRYARLYSKDKKVRWEEQLKSEFTLRLDKTKDSGIEFSAVNGWHIRNLLYLDEQWVKDHFNEIFDLKSDNHWEAAFTGYLLTHDTLYHDLFNLFNSNGHYKKGIVYKFKDKQANESLVQDIVLGFLAGWDDLENKDGLMCKLVNCENIELLNILVNKMWSFRDKFSKEINAKIKPLWKIIYERTAPNLSIDSYQGIASNLINWLALIDTIDDDILKWMEISIQNVDDIWKTISFIENLRAHVLKTPKLVGALYLKMLEANNYPAYKTEDIIYVVQSLYDFYGKGEVTVNKICNMYFEKGFEFLRKTFEKNN